MTCGKEPCDYAPVADEEEVIGLDELLVHVRWVVYSSLITEDERTQVQQIQTRLVTRRRTLDLENNLVPSSGNEVLP